MNMCIPNKINIITQGSVLYVNDCPHICFDYQHYYLPFVVSIALMFVLMIWPMFVAMICINNLALM